MSSLTSARPGIGRPGMVVPALLVQSGPVKASGAATVTDPRDGTATVT